MPLPNDPVMLLSVVNTQLRDMYSSLEDLADAHDTDVKIIVDKLQTIGYTYSKAQNQFI